MSHRDRKNIFTSGSLHHGNDGIEINGRRLVVTRAVARGKVPQLAWKKKEEAKSSSDARNLSLAREGCKSKQKKKKPARKLLSDKYVFARAFFFAS